MSTTTETPTPPPAARDSKYVPGAIIFSLGSVLTYLGFHFGFKKQLKLAMEEMSDHPPPPSSSSSSTPGAAQTVEEVLANGQKARSLAIKALVRGSMVAACIAAAAGIGLSFVVEAHHKGHSKEAEEKEMAEIYKLSGLASILSPPEKKKAE